MATITPGAGHTPEQETPEQRYANLQGPWGWVKRKHGSDYTSKRYSGSPAELQRYAYALAVQRYSEFTDSQKETWKLLADLDGFSSAQKGKRGYHYYRKSMLNSVMHSNVEVPAPVSLSLQVLKCNMRGESEIPLSAISKKDGKEYLKVWLGKSWYQVNTQNYGRPTSQATGLMPTREPYDFRIAGVLQPQKTAWEIGNVTTYSVCTLSGWVLRIHCDPDVRYSPTYPAMDPYRGSIDYDNKKIYTPLIAVADGEAQIVHQDNYTVCTGKPNYPAGTTRFSYYEGGVEKGFLTLATYKYGTFELPKTQVCITASGKILKAQLFTIVACHYAAPNYYKNWGLIAYLWLE